MDRDNEERKRNHIIDDLWRNWIFAGPLIMAYDGIMKPSEKTKKTLWILYTVSFVALLVYHFSFKN